MAHLNGTTKDLEHNKFGLDLQGNPYTRTVAGSSLKDHYDLINSSGFLTGISYEYIACIETDSARIRTFYFFDEGGSELFHIPVSEIINPPTGSTGAIGLVKHDPDPTTTDIIFSQDELHKNDPIGNHVGSLAALGDSSVTFEIAQDISGPTGGSQFEVFELNKLRNTSLIDTGTYEIFIKATGANGSFIAPVSINVNTAGPIHNVTLSNFTIQGGSTIGSTVGILDITGGAPPASFVLTEDTDNKFELTGTNNATLITTDTVTTGQAHDIIITATDQNGETRPQAFTIEVVADTFADVFSLSQDGVAEYLYAADAPSLRFTTKMSAIVFVKPAVGASGNREFLAKWNANTGNASYAMRANSSNQFVSLFTANGTTAFTVTHGTVTIDEWHSFGFTFNNGVVKHYVDGSPVGTTDISANVPDIYPGVADFTIGSRIDGTGARSNYWDGLTNDPAVFDEVLSDAQMLAIGATPVNQKTKSSATDLVSWWLNGDNFASSLDPDEQGANTLTGFAMNNSNRSTDVP